jgi:phosphoribosylaminoimidazole-succinocarboxamide synthase
MTTLPLSIPGLNHLYKGKVREVYEIDDQTLLLVTSDRVSAYDCVFAEPVPFKAQVLNLLSAYWFQETRALLPNHFVATQVEECLPHHPDLWESLRGRVALVRRTVPIRYECVVRGHLDGSAWKEYQHSGTVCGVALPAGLNRYDRLPAPMFTPATKNDEGHDENVSFEVMAADLGMRLAERLRTLSLAVYEFGYNRVLAKGLLLLDTKFEFGFAGEELLLIDEVLTPDSSRYRAVGEKGTVPMALDKQYLRDALAAQGFTGEGTPPALSAETTQELARRYKQVFHQITGQQLEDTIRQKG